MTALAFASVALVHLLAAISPGPSFVLSLRTAAAEGFRPAVGLAIGFGVGAAIWALAALLGLSLLFQVIPILFTLLKVGGAIFLIWIGFMMWRHARDPLPEVSDGTPRGLTSAIRLGILTMFANPKPAVFFGAVFLGFVPAETTLQAKAIIVFNIFWVEAAWYILVARVFSLPAARRAYVRLKTGLDRSLGVAMGLLGLRLALPT
ncbi:transporter [Jannaschia pagri]|uniref:Transporter n=1 Tax=Jannaschia pagri TaxID=2829797 RepID=A0ABQ4NN03_9RHOB|nr:MULTISPECIES: LysE family transporter [unclassified Jannaschia]GIT91958.1 transporter [Jannaschia sp. AI_61]GIT95792.1 transporter [Jannaschia sp. AI_62]